MEADRVVCLLLAGGLRDGAAYLGAVNVSRSLIDGQIHERGLEDRRRDSVFASTIEKITEDGIHLNRRISHKIAIHGGRQRGADRSNLGPLFFEECCQWRIATRASDGSALAKGGKRQLGATGNRHDLPDTSAKQAGDGSPVAPTSATYPSESA